MFSSRTKLGLRLLHELGKDMEQKMTVSELKRRMGLSIGMREPEWVLRDLNNASLVSTDWKNGRPRYFFSPNTGNATLYDLVMAVDNQFCIWSGYKSWFPLHQLLQVDEAEVMVDREVCMILKRIPLIGLIRAPQEGNEGMPLTAMMTTANELSPA